MATNGLKQRVPRGGKGDGCPASRPGVPTLLQYPGHPTASLSGGSSQGMYMYKWDAPLFYFPCPRSRITPWSTGWQRHDAGPTGAAATHANMPGWRRYPSTFSLYGQQQSKPSVSPDCHRFRPAGTVAQGGSRCPRRAAATSSTQVNRQVVLTTGTAGCRLNQRALLTAAAGTTTHGNLGSRPTARVPPAVPWVEGNTRQRRRRGRWRRRRHCSCMSVAACCAHDACPARRMPVIFRGDRSGDAACRESPVPVGGGTDNAGPA